MEIKKQWWSALTQTNLLNLNCTSSPVILLLVFSSFSFLPPLFLLLFSSSSNNVTWRPEGTTFTVEENQIEGIPTPLKVGDIVSFSYEAHSRRDIPSGVLVYRIRSDIKWDDILSSSSSLSPLSSRRGFIAGIVFLFSLLLFCFLIVL